MTKITYIRYVGFLEAYYKFQPFSRYWGKMKLEPHYYGDDRHIISFLKYIVDDAKR